MRCVRHGAPWFAKDGSDDRSAKLAVPEAAEPQSIERRTAFFNQVAAVADLPADLRDAFEERAAIAEFDGGLDRAATERLAWAEVTGEGEP
jgi:hypothetical protein